MLNSDNGDFTGQVYTIDPLAPLVVSIDRTNPPGADTNAVSVTFTVTLSQATTGVRLSDFQLVSGGTVGSTLTQMAPVSGAVYTVTVSGITGNGTLGLNCLTFIGQVYTIDTIAPYVESINRAIPSTPTTNASSVSFTVTFSEAVTGVAVADFQLALGGTATGTVSQVTPVSASVYTVTVGGVMGNGTLGLNLVDNASIRDLAGNPLTQQNAQAALEPQQTFATGTHPTSLAVGDFNGDGIPDLVVGNTELPTAGSGILGTVSVLLGNGNGTFQTQQTLATGSSPRSVVVGDVNGDGIPDIIVGDFASNTVSVLLGNGNGTFQAQRTFATVGVSPRSLALGDVNGDGKPDILFPNGYNNCVTVLLGNGNGTFQAQQTFANGAYPGPITIGDLTGDGIPDLVVADGSSGAVSVLQGNGNGTFAAPQTFAAADTGKVVLGDVNGDGIPDIVAADYGSNAVSVLLGNGNETFQAQRTFATGFHPTSVAIVDLNGDGNSDLIVSNSGGNSASVLLGNGNGTFQGPQTFATGNDPESVVVADVNSDGRPELLVANDGSNTISVLLNAVNGNFTGQLYTISVAANTHFAVTVPNFSTTGNGFVFTVTALDANGSPNLAYNGTVHFTSTDPLAGLPADAALFNGTGLFAAVLKTLGTQTISATDTSTHTDTGTSAPITVVPPATASFSVAANPHVIPAGSAVVLEVAALDAKSNVIPSFNGTIHFTSSDAQASLPADAMLTNGIGFFTAILKTAGLQTFGVSDLANGGATGTSAPITVTPGAATHFGVSAPAAAVTGNAFVFTVTALDSYGNIAPSYAGTVHFTSTDSAAALPPDSTLRASVGIFTATLNTAGNNTLSALSTVTTSIAGISGIIATRGLAVSTFTPTPTGFAVTFDKAFNPATISLYVGTPDVKLVTSSGQTVRGSLVLNTAAERRPTRRSHSSPPPDCWRPAPIPSPSPAVQVVCKTLAATPAPPS